ncbi:hypothetical protein [Microbulbifer thermotolerans]|uniref:Uncharacterized protein n=1 Tax=Microbulbifer thermotolerans TaxID=252514 RepID=A0A143HPT7_MICTH|nr:hypothetical protein [Microbulbifer thermotolerans]AMX03440.1 hypothetical protein A3224_13430 [Microbulbifer thermotolerans]MCX2833025.1 hypothetical protein [Microbulbifer thermotolerans]MCX2835439.1 hypothetical protein [Microbulbifer thermotolerans]MCX2842390.1 hypothetical protein [Microbulbifer thermotolerans]WKT60045.1 hypothetical protein Q2E61_14200 [Microbulbifer thermotolerans]
MKKLIKWVLGIFGVVAGIVTVLFTLSVYRAPKPNDLISYHTKNFNFKIPYRFVVPGTLPNQSPAEGFDTEGPDIFIWFNGAYTKEHIPEFKLKGGKDDRYFRNIHVTLSDGSEQEMTELWSWNKRFEPLSLSGDFENGFVEYDDDLGLYRVFREHEGKKLGGFWDLVTVKPTTDYEPSNSYKGLWVGSCYQNADGVETSCSFIVDVLGMYTKISATEDDYLRLKEIKTMVATHLQGWEATTM